MDLDLRREEARADPAVTALYQAHALGLIRLAHVMLGDRAAAEDPRRLESRGEQHEVDPWTTPPGYGASLIWLADNRTLALAGAPVRDYRRQVLELDTTAPGTSFAADARVAARMSSSSRLIWRQLMITPDGRTLLVVRETPRRNGWPITGTVRLQRYDVRAGTGVVDIRQVRLGEFDELQWSGQSGRVLITLQPLNPPQLGPGVHTERTAAIIVGHRRYPLPWSRTAIEGAW